MKQGIIFVLLLVGMLFHLSLHGQSLLWAEDVNDGSTGSSPYAVATDPSGNLWFSGIFWDTIDVDPGPGIALLYPGNPVGYHTVFILKLDSLGQYLWAGSVAGNPQDKSTDITVDAAGNVYLVGGFSGTNDFDPGPGVLNLTAPSPNGVFIMKLNNAGALQWVKVVPGNNGNKYYSLDLDAAGNVYVGGEFRFTGDFDPGPGTFTMTAPSNNPAGFLLKLDNGGNFVWARALISTLGASISEVRFDGADNLYLAGYFTQTVDFDMGAGLYNLSCVGSSDLFLLKLTPSGNFNWVKAIGGPLSELPYGLHVSPAGVVTLTGQTDGNTDFDPGIGTLQLPHAGGRDYFVERLDSTGAMVWAKSMGGIGDEWPADLRANAAGEVFTIGYFTEMGDFDPGPGTLNLPCHSWANAFIQKLDAAGNLVFAKSYNSTNLTYGYVVELGSMGSFYTGGGYGGTIDFDLSPGNQDITFPFGGFGLARYLDDSCFTLAMNLDSLRHITCANPLGFASVSVMGAHGAATVSWNTTPATSGLSANFTSPGIYTALVTDARGCAADLSVLVAAPTFPTGIDLSTNIIATDFRPGFESTFQVQAANGACTPANGQLEVAIDPTLQYVSAIPAPASVLGNTLTWNFTGLSHGGSAFTPSITVLTPIGTQMGDTVCLTATALPLLGDQNPSNNHDTTCVVVTNAFDPNDKRVDPLGVCQEHFVFRGTPLTYTVRFQNTGTAAATNVHIVDGLDPSLDLSTLRVLAQSHPMTTQVLPGNILEFAFDNIQLPDSHANEPASHGYVRYEISPMVGVTAGTEVHNRAAIYFDFNPAVFTERVLSTITDTLPIRYFGDTAIVCRGGSYTFLDGTTVNNVSADMQHASPLPSPDGCPVALLTQLFVLPDTNISFTSGTLTSNASLGWGQYQWLDCNANFAPIPGANSQLFTPTVSGSYALEIDQLGCLDTSSCWGVQVATVSYYYDTATVCSGASFTFHDGVVATNITAPTSHTSHFAVSSGDSAVVTQLWVNVVNTTVVNTGFQLEAQALGATFQWLDCNGQVTAIPGETANVFNPPFSGNWAVAVTENGCTDTSSCVSFAVGLDAGNNAWSLELIPNPAQTQVLVRAGLPLGSITLTNALGVVALRHEAGDATEIQLDLRQLSSGIYSIHAGAADSRLRPRRLVIQ